MPLAVRILASTSWVLLPSRGVRFLTPLAFLAALATFLPLAAFLAFVGFFAVDFFVLVVAILSSFGATGLGVSVSVVAGAADSDLISSFMRDSVGLMGTHLFRRESHRFPRIAAGLMATALRACPASSFLIRRAVASRLICSCISRRNSVAGFLILNEWVHTIPESGPHAAARWSWVRRSSAGRPSSTMIRCALVNSISVSSNLHK